MHHTAEFSKYAGQLYAAEEEAKKRGQKLWLGWSEQEKAAKVSLSLEDQHSRCHSPVHHYPLSDSVSPATPILASFPMTFWWRLSFARITIQIVRFSL